MASTIKLKNGSGAPTTGDLVQGEPALDLTNKRLYTENASGVVIEVGTNPSTIDINAGTIDNTVIGGSTAAAGTFTTFTSTGIDDNATSTAITIDASENVGIGVTSPSSYYATQLVVNGGTDGGITVVNTTTGDGRLMFADGTSGADRYTGQIFYNHASNYMAFGTNGGAERMRIDSSGSVGIGTSSPAQKAHIYESTAATGAFLQTQEVGGQNAYFGVNTSGGSIQVSGAYPLQIATNGSERMRIDSSGNLGLGVTPSAWSGVTALQVSGSAALYATNSVTGLSFNQYFNGTNNIYLQDDFSNRFQMDSGAFKFFTAPSGTAGNAITFTQAMTLDASGRLMLGTTTPYSRITIKGVSGIPNGYGIVGPDVSNGCYFGAISSVANDDFEIWNERNGYFRIGTNNAERMRIDSSGNLLVGTTSADPGGTGSAGRVVINTLNGGQAALTCYNAGTSAVNIVSLENGNGQVGRIQVNGTATSYLTSSDYRLKETVQPMTGALAKVQALKPVTYKWKVDGSDGQGFIAHELQAVVPDCVAGEKDAVDAEGNPQYQGIDTSFLVATLTAAIQEQQEQINELKAEVAALKGAN
jgi:hypothetical protein